MSCNFYKTMLSFIFVMIYHMQSSVMLTLTRHDTYVLSYFKASPNFRWIDHNTWENYYSSFHFLKGMKKIIDLETSTDMTGSYDFQSGKTVHISPAVDYHLYVTSKLAYTLVSSWLLCLYLRKRLTVINAGLSWHPMSTKLLGQQRSKWEMSRIVRWHI